jgi:hypothetical protein
MKKAISIVVAMSVVLTTLWLSGLDSSAQQSGKGARPKDEDALAKSPKKNWDKLPPQAKLATSPEAKTALEKLTPRQRERVKAKVLEIIRNGKAQSEKEIQAKQATLKTWEDVIKKEGKNSGEDETLGFTDKAGRHHVAKAKRHDGRINPDARLR